MSGDPDKRSPGHPSTRCHCMLQVQFQPAMVVHYLALCRCKESTKRTKQHGISTRGSVKARIPECPVIGRPYVVNVQPLTSLGARHRSEQTGTGLFQVHLREEKRPKAN